MEEGVHEERKIMWTSFKEAPQGTRVPTNLHGEPPFDLLELCELRLGLLVVGDGLDAAVVPHRSDARVHDAPNEGVISDLREFTQPLLLWYRHTLENSRNLCRYYFTFFW